MQLPPESPWKTPGSIDDPFKGEEDFNDSSGDDDWLNDRERIRTPFTEEPKKEAGPTTPEILANPPLKDTSLIYSIPIRGEWANGNVLRHLHAMFSQGIADGQALEIEFVANHGGLDLRPRAEPEIRKAAQQKVDDTALSMNFIKRVIRVQALARLIQQHGTRKDAQEKFQQTLNATPDPLERDVLQLAMDKAMKVSVMLVDTTKMNFAATEYKEADIESVRTLGIDILMTRYEGREDIPVNLFDVDTIPQTTRTVHEMQQLFKKQPRLSYVFSGLMNSVRGISKDFASQIHSGLQVRYNQGIGHGSPQICFRLGCYQKLKTIQNFLLIGDEDRDTAIRLIYHFGTLQDGLLFEESIDGSPVHPTLLTAARLDGFNDGRASAYTEGKIHPIERDFGELVHFRAEVLRKIDQLPPFKREMALEALKRAREEQFQRQQTQQRMNRLVMNAFLKAVQDGSVKLQDDTLHLDETKILSLQGGKALLFYLRHNQQIAKEVLSSQEDMACLRYDLGQTDTFPAEVESRTPFQKALREYIGEATSCADLEQGGMYDWTLEKKRDHLYPTIDVQDHRSKESRLSFLTAFTTELLALGHTYRLFFQTSDFFEARDPSKSDHNAEIWPKDKEKQQLPIPYHFGTLEGRLEKLKPAIERASVPEDDLTSTVQRLSSAPIVGLWQELEKATKKS